MTLGPQNEAEIFGRQSVPLTIAEGTMGWNGLEDVVEEIGDASNGGVTLVRATLHRGAPPGAPVASEGGANGHRVLVRLGFWPFWVIPPKGMPCMIAFPNNDMNAGVVFCGMGVNPFKQFHPTGAKVDLPGYSLVLKADDVTMMSDATDPDSGERLRHTISVSAPGGCRAEDDTGGGLFIRDGEITIRTQDGGGNIMSTMAFTQDELKFGFGSSTQKMNALGTTWCGVVLKLQYSAALALGPAPSPAYKVYGGPGAPLAALPLTGVFATP